MYRCFSDVESAHATCRWKRTTQFEEIHCDDLSAHNNGTMRIHCLNVKSTIIDLKLEKKTLQKHVTNATKLGSERPDQRPPALTLRWVPTQNHAHNGNRTRRRTNHVPPPFSAVSARNPFGGAPRTPRNHTCDDRKITEHDYLRFSPWTEVVFSRSGLVSTEFFSTTTAVAPWSGLYSTKG